MKENKLEDRWFSRGEAMSKKAERAHLSRQIAQGEIDEEYVKAISFHSLPIWQAICMCGWKGEVEANDQFSAEALASVIHDLQVHPHCEIYDGISIKNIL